MLWLDPFFLDTRRGEVHNIANTRGELQQLVRIDEIGLLLADTDACLTRQLSQLLLRFKALTSTCASNPSKLYIYVRQLNPLSLFL